MKSSLVARRRLPIPHQTEAEDRLLAMVVALSSEMATLRERLDTAERLLDSRAILPRAAIEDFVADPQQAAERDGLRMQLIARVFRPLRDDAARAAAALDAIHAGQEAA